MTFDDLIAQGICEMLEEEYTEYRPDGKEHRFSAAYKINRALIINFRKTIAPLSVRSVKNILTAAVLALFALLGAGLFKVIFKGRSK